MPSETTAETKTEREARTSVPSPQLPRQPVVAPIDTLPDRRIGSRENTRLIDDLAPAKGIMVSLLLGMTLWGCIVAFCLR
jgi:hypothetical protein